MQTSKLKINSKVAEDTPTVHSVLARSSDSTKQIILNIRFWLRNNYQVEERIRKSMFSYYFEKKGLIWIQPGVNTFIIHLRKGNYDNRYNLIKFAGWGGYPELRIKSAEFDSSLKKYVEDMIFRAFRN